MPREGQGQGQGLALSRNHAVRIMETDSEPLADAPEGHSVARGVQGWELQAPGLGLEAWRRSCFLSSPA